MLSKRNTSPATTKLHTVSPFSQQPAPKGVWYYWPLLLFILLSAFSQTFGSFFSG